MLDTWITKIEKYKPTIVTQSASVTKPRSDDSNPMKASRVTLNDKDDEEYFISYCINHKSCPTCDIDQST